MDEGADLGEELVNIFESIDQNVQTSVTQVTNPAIIKKYKALAVKMLSMIKEYDYLFDYMSFSHKKYLNMIPK